MWLIPYVYLQENNAPPSVYQRHISPSQDSISWSGIVCIINYLGEEKMFGVRKEQYIKLACIRMGKQENKK